VVTVDARPDRETVQQAIRTALDLPPLLVEKEVSA
jgi:hypothetical protein